VSRDADRIKEEAKALDAMPPRTDINPWTGKPFDVRSSQQDRNQARLMFAAWRAGQ